MLHTVIDNTIVDIFFFYKILYRTTGSDTIDRSQMVVMPIFNTFLGVDILAKCRFQISTFQVMSCQCISCKYCIYVAVCHQLGKSISGITVKAERRSHDPYYIAMLFFMM